MCSSDLANASSVSLDDVQNHAAIRGTRLFNHQTIVLASGSHLFDGLETSFDAGPSYHPFMTSLAHLAADPDLLATPKPTLNRYQRAGLRFFTMLDSAGPRGRRAGRAGADGSLGEGGRDCGEGSGKGGGSGGDGVVCGLSGAAS